MKQMHLLIKGKPLFLSLLFTLGVGGLSSLITGSSVENYQTLIKPGFAPPSLAFPIVWTILYLTMAFAAYLILVAKAPVKEKRLALVLYGVQLLINASWSVVFFRFGLLDLGFWVIALLLLLIVSTYRAFLPVNKTAAHLLIPYFLWCVFALALNYAIASLNA